MKKFFMEEEISKDFKNRVFSAVAPELAKNKRTLWKKRLMIFAPALMGLIVVFVIGLNYIQKNEPFFFEKQSDVVIFPSHDLEFYENMGVLEHFDDLQNMDDESAKDTHHDET